MDSSPAKRFMNLCDKNLGIQLPGILAKTSSRTVTTIQGKISFRFSRIENLLPKDAVSHSKHVTQLIDFMRQLLCM